MGRPLSVSPPPEFTDDAKLLWRAAVRQLQEQGTWRTVDRPLLESYVQSVMAAREARSEGRHRAAAQSERDATHRATALMLTPDTRRNAPNARARTQRTGMIESGSSVA